MQVTETVNTGLKRQIKVTVPASDMEAKLMERLADAKTKVRLNGFRPGKVPVQHLRKMYGKSFMAEVVNEIISDSQRSIVEERGEKAAMEPEVVMTEDEQEAEKILAGNADFEFSLDYEIIPEIEVGEFSGIKITRQVYEVTDEEVEDQVNRVTASLREFEEKKGKAADGDRVTIDYLGKLDGEPFEGGAAEDSALVLGSGEFIPGFEEKLVGVKAGDETTISVTFPEDYGAQHLAGREASFDVKVKKVEKPGEFELNDEEAQKLGVETAERLRELVREQLVSQYGSMTRQKAKRQLLDALDEQYKFETPSKLVETEFNNIWGQVLNDLERAGSTFADEDTTEEEAREEYGKLAERRVRLGLLLAEIGEKANVQITDDEMQRAFIEQLRRVPQEQQQQLAEFYRSNPQALANIRAPLFEEKVVDHLLGEIDVTDKEVTREELLADDDEAASDEAKGDEVKKDEKKAAPKKKAAKKSTGKAEKAEPADKEATDE